MVAAGTATMSPSLLPSALQVFGREEDDRSPITKGDVAILTFLKNAASCRAFGKVS
jgi:hypothetical protein